MVVRDFIVAALEDLGYEYEVGDLQVRGFGDARSAVEIRVRTKSPGFDIGFRKAGGTYEVVADWWGIKDVTKEKFLGAVTQRYAYRTARSVLETRDGFSLASEEVDDAGRIHLVLRRMA